MATKIKVGIMFGGRSTEHEISIRSARSIVQAIDTKKYKITLIGIDKNGTWLSEADSAKLLKTGTAPKKKAHLMPAFDLKKVDVVFPVLHGSFGEDGTMQGFLKLVDVPFVGPSVLGSAVGMDKDVAKRLLNEAGIGVARGFVFKKHEMEAIKFAPIKKKLGLPMFVKPANAGSSVGVSKVRNEKEFYTAIKNAFMFDTKILIEEGIVGREIEVAVLGNECPEAAIAGEIIPGEEFYSYDDKYASTSASVVEIPANISKTTMEKVRATAVQAYSVLGLEGMSRVDFFLKKDGSLILNEVNTIPGFTSISMYPKMWEAAGVPFPKLIDKLLSLAIERNKREKALKTSI